jgi:hypothetical protein
MNRSHPRENIEPLRAQSRKESASARHIHVSARTTRVAIAAALDARLSDRTTAFNKFAKDAIVLTDSP